MRNKRFTVTEILKRTLLGLLVISAFSTIVMVLWNLLIPEIFGLKAINFWQAVAMFALTRILFGHFWGGRPGEHHHHHDFGKDNHIREKWMEMTSEERREFFNRRKDFFRNHPFNREDFWKRRTNRTDQNETTEGEQ